MSCIRSAHTPEKIREIWGAVRKKDSWDIYTINAIIYAYGRCGRFDYAWGFYKYAVTSLPDQVTPSTFSSMLVVLERFAIRAKLNSKKLLHVVDAINQHVMNYPLPMERTVFNAIERLVNKLMKIERIDNVFLSEAMQLKSVVLDARAKLVINNSDEIDCVIQKKTQESALKKEVINKVRFFYNPYTFDREKVRVFVKSAAPQM